MFVHGKTFHDGGWFDSSSRKPWIEVKSSRNGPWEKIADIESYPKTSASEPAGLKAGEAFSTRLEKAVTVYGVRVCGKPASGDNPKQAFATCGELQAFGMP